jgi:NAD-dependent SIR2 family protein deacetylase
VVGDGQQCGCHPKSVKPAIICFGAHLPSSFPALPAV